MTRLTHVLYSYASAFSNFISKKRKDKNQLAVMLPQSNDKERKKKRKMKKRWRERRNSAASCNCLKRKGNKKELRQGGTV